MNKNTKHFAQSNIDIVAPVRIVKTDSLTSLAEYHHKGGEFIEDLPVWVERNARTALIPTVLKSWKIGSVKMDLTGYGKYSESSTMVVIDGKEVSWPFSMVYLREENAGN